MKFLSILALAGSLANALPVESAATGEMIEWASEADARMTESLLVRTDLETGSSSKCPKAILIYARGSTEPGNMGIVVGPALTKGLTQEFGSGNIWIQGVGAPYYALLTPNFLPEGTNRASIDEAKRLFTMANKKCPNTPVVAAGYSQGTAVVGNALSELTGAVQNQVTGAALFGYTKNKQLGGRIRNFPTEKTKIYCEPGDAVCYGTLIILPGHILYADDAAGPARAFLAGRINSKKA